MTEGHLSVWHPEQADREHSEIARLIRAIGCENYDELLQLAEADPARYWNVVQEYCGIVWDVEPTAYVDLSRGPEFPQWFPDGRLNWVNTVLSYARRADSSGRLALVAESEDGSTRQLTYAQLAQQVSDFAAGLAVLGVGRGDRVGLMMENGIEATVSALAIAYMGAIMVPLFSGFGVDAIISRFTAAEVSFVISTTGFARRTKRVNVESPMREAWARTPAVRGVVWKRGQGEQGGKANGDARDHDWNDVLELGSERPLPAASMGANDPFMVIYTSGTTGKPKGVVHTHGSFPLKIAHDSAVHFNVREGDVYCWPADMGWIAGSLVLSSALLRGATLVCYDGAPDYPDWSRMSRLVERHGVTHFGSAPTLIRGMAGNEALALKGDVSSIRMLITAGEGIDPEHFSWFQQSFGRGVRPLINYTGGTEVSGALLSSVVVRPIPPSGFNTTSPGVNVAVVDATGAPVVDVVGELAVREPFVGMTQSFWKDDQRYLETYWRTTPGIWVHGDLAMHRSSDGNYFMMGRSDDTLKVAGKRLGPAEVEEVVLELDAIAEAAAIGVADADKGQRLVIFVVTVAGTEESDEALLARVSQHVDVRLGRPFRPSAVHVVKQLPKTRTTKIMRRVIRSVYTGAPPGDLSSLDNPAALDEIRAVAP